MESQPRSIGQRVTLMMVLVVCAGGLGGALSVVTNEWIGSSVVVVLYAYLATRVSLPWYHVAWFVVPIIGMIAFFRISWRVAYLPWRDWDLREDEEPGPYDLVPSPIAVRAD
jgi:hypothetical protein